MGGGATEFPGALQRVVSRRPQKSGGRQTVVIVERWTSLSRDYAHVFDYLGLRPHPVRAEAELDAALGVDPPIAIIWELAAGLDSGAVLHTISAFDRHLPVLIVADTPRTPGVIDSMIRFLHIADVVKLSSEPAIRDVVEFLFRAGRKRGGFHVLSV